MVKFVQVEDEVVSVELSVETLRRIGNAFLVMENEGVADDRDKALGAGFENAYERLTSKEEEPLAEWERLLLEGPRDEQ